MIFLIRYDRSAGRLQTFDRYADAQRDEAEQRRLELELEVNALGVPHEVLLLEAPDEAALHRTHQRYFNNLAELAEATRLVLAEPSSRSSGAVILR